MAEIRRYEPGARLSRVVVHGDTAYFSGLTAGDRSGDVQAQARELLAKADALLATIGSRRAHILRATIWLRDIGDFAAMNAVWEQWIDPAHPPARATVAAALAAPDIAIEIQFTVAVGALPVSG